jgi:hypothetical protein
MIAEFLYRITTKIRRFGQTKVRARIMVRFLVNGRIIVAMVRGMKRVRTCDLMSGRGTGYCGQVAAAQYYAPFDIHRQAPALS